MDRRAYLRAAGAASVPALAGCLDVAEVVGLGDSGETVLGPPEMERGDPSHPIHGEELPSFEVPDPLREELVTGEQFRGERAILMTFFYTNCPDGACPQLLQRLVHVQHGVRDAGYEADAAFLALTFDPERDTPDVLADHADAYGIDPTGGNWHFLRPETADDASRVINDDFGLPILREDEGDHDHGGDGENSTDDADHDHDGDDYTFTHFNLILLANERGVVERSYPNATTVQPTRIEGDMLTVLEG